MEIEIVKSLYFDEDALRIPVYSVKRIEQNDMRFYTAHDSNGNYIKGRNGIFYQSVTTFIKNSQPTPIGLQKWYAEKGWERAKEEAREAADYGTLMHIIFGSFLLNGLYHLESIKSVTEVYLQEKGYGNYLLNSWVEDLSSDLLAFAQWCADYDVKPLAVELTLISPKLGVAGTLDLFCQMNDKCYTEKTEKEKRKRTYAIVDFKSGRKGFYDDYEVQLKAYEALWQENFPEDLQPQMLFNWSPKSWRKSPDYNLKNQTESTNTELLEHFIRIAEIKGESRKPTFYEYNGEVRLGEVPANNFILVDETEILKRIEKPIV